MLTKRLTGEEIAIPCFSRMLRMIRSVFDGRVRDLVGAGRAERVVELREQQRVDPLRVGRPLDALDEVGCTWPTRS